MSIKKDVLVKGKKTQKKIFNKTQVCKNRESFLMENTGTEKKKKMNRYLGSVRMFRLN